MMEKNVFENQLFNDWATIINTNFTIIIMIMWYNIRAYWCILKNYRSNNNFISRDRMTFVIVAIFSQFFIIFPKLQYFLNFKYI